MTTNQNGFLVDEHGIIRALETAISDCKVSGLPRRAYHVGFSINQNMQMVQQIGVRTYTADGVKPVGEEIKEVYADPRLLNQQLDKWRDPVVSVTTEGAYVNPQTGAFVEPSADGAIEQLAMMQSLNAQKLRQMGMPIATNGTTPTLNIIYMLLLAEIQKQDGLGRL